MVALAAGVVLLADRIWSTTRLTTRTRTNQYLTDNIKELDKQIAEIRDLQKRRNQLLDRMRVIQELQGNRPIIVRVLDQLVRTVPDGVFYTKLSTKGKKSPSAVSRNQIIVCPV